MNTIQERIQYIVDQYFNGNVTAYSRETGISQSTLKDILGKKKFNPSNQTVARLLSGKTLKLNLTWLFSGEGNIFETSEINGKSADINEFMNVPLIPIRGKAGYLTGYGDMEYIETLPLIPCIVNKEYKGKYRCFEVDGDSMDDDSRSSICDRDIVLGREVRPELWKSKLHIRDWYFIIVHKDGISIKDISDHDVERGIITCHSLNRAYDDFQINLKDVYELYNLINVVFRTAKK